MLSFDSYLNPGDNELCYPIDLNPVASEAYTYGAIGKISSGICLGTIGVTSLISSGLVRNVYERFFINRSEELAERQSKWNSYSLGLMGLAGLGFGTMLIVQGLSELYYGAPVEDDLCSLDATICSGNWNILRNLMPQVKGKVLRNFLDQHGYECVVELPRYLSPIQKEAFLPKVRSLIQAISEKGVGVCMDMPILISRDGKIIDGHHRYYACKILGTPITAFRVDLLASEALQILKDFAGVTQEEFGQF